ncbi:hypothetical protein K504DRAFT_524854 [Pleomassaria siparia CBS 279.74]|uniref:Uncharacterized protein n=1 Tax=Pleomassaria siparia CBS 279.74 TaxID=1314801 RepID=A0A6G1KC75_9PLEO|nr:hypothetical protein K504DRAFT_524854 [Pleomassaria siparia CBS 279.74]
MRFELVIYYLSVDSFLFVYIHHFPPLPITYDHRTMNTRLPVRSALFKHCTGGLVVKWVTIGESLLLYVFFFSFFFSCKQHCQSDILRTLRFRVKEVS